MITQSERLWLEKPSLEDAPFILNLLNSPGWLKYIGDRGVKSIEDAEAYLTNGPMKDFETYGFSLFKVMLKSTAEPIGLCGLLKRSFLDDPDIGFAFLPVVSMLLLPLWGLMVGFLQQQKPEHLQRLHILKFESK